MPLQDFPIILLVDLDGGNPSLPPKSFQPENMGVVGAWIAGEAEEKNLLASTFVDELKHSYQQVLEDTLVNLSRTSSFPLKSFSFEFEIFHAPPKTPGVLIYLKAVFEDSDFQADSFREHFLEPLAKVFPFSMVSFDPLVSVIVANASQHLSSFSDLIEMLKPTISSKIEKDKLEALPSASTKSFNARL